MANITDSDGWVDVTRPESTDLALGGNETNFPGRFYRELASRDRWIRSQLETLFGLGDASAQTTTQEFTQLGVSAIAQGRLSLVAGNPSGETEHVSTVYYTPFNGDFVSLYESANTRWIARQFSETSLDISSFSSNTNYDIFAYWNGTTVVLAGVPWANSEAGISARATQLVRLNGARVSSADATRRFIGTIRTTSVAGRVTDSPQYRYVWSNDNQISKTMSASDGVTNYTYGTPTYRVANNSFASSLFCVNGAPNQTITAIARITLQNNANLVSIGVGLNSSDPFGTPVANMQAPSQNNIGTMATTRPLELAEGLNYIAPVEWAQVNSNLRNPSIFALGLF